MKIRKFSIRKTQRTVYEINPILLSLLVTKNPRKATIIIPTPVTMRTYGKNSGSDSETHGT